MESLYQLIHRSLTPEGLLPEDFSLPKPDGNQIHFADGAMDGITIFPVSYTHLRAHET